MQSGAVKCQRNWSGASGASGAWGMGGVRVGDLGKVYAVLIYFFAGKLKWDLLRFGHSDSKFAHSSRRGSKVINKQKKKRRSSFKAMRHSNASAIYGTLISASSKTNSKFVTDYVRRGLLLLEGYLVVQYVSPLT